MNDSMRPEVATLGCTFLSILISCHHTLFSFTQPPVRYIRRYDSFYFYFTILCVTVSCFSIIYVSNSFEGTVSRDPCLL